MPPDATIRQAIPRRRGHAHYATSARPSRGMLARGCPARGVERATSSTAARAVERPTLASTQRRARHVERQQHTASSTARPGNGSPRAPARGHRRAISLQQRAAIFSAPIRPTFPRAPLARASVKKDRRPSSAAALFSSAKKRSSKFFGRAAPRFFDLERELTGGRDPRDLLLEDRFIRREDPPARSPRPGRASAAIII